MNKTGFILKCGELFFVSLIRNKLSLTSDEKKAWFVEYNREALWMSAELEKRCGVVCKVASYTHKCEHSHKVEELGVVTCLDCGEMAE